MRTKRNAAKIRRVAMRHGLERRLCVLAVGVIDDLIAIRRLVETAIGVETHA